MVENRKRAEELLREATTLAACLETGTQGEGRAAGWRASSARYVPPSAGGGGGGVCRQPDTPSHRPPVITLMLHSVACACVAGGLLERLLPKRAKQYAKGVSQKAA